MKGMGTFRRVVLSETVVGNTHLTVENMAEGLVGRRGTAITTLRPSGIIEIQGRRLDAVSEGEFIAPGTPIIVVEDKGLSVVVSKDR